MIDSEDGAKRWLSALPECDERAMGRLERLATLLADENTRQNLVSARSLDAVWQRHIADSAQLLARVPRGAAPWLDLGTGAGFPGMVIAILRPNTPVMLVESRSLRAEWLLRLGNMLGLNNICVIPQKLELVESFTAAVISARAFTALDRLIALSARFSTSDTLWLLPKGRSAGDELQLLRSWHHTFHVEQSLMDSEAGIITGHLVGRKE